MDTSRFRDRSTGFPVLDLAAVFTFRTATSISFDLGRHSDTLRFPDTDFVMKTSPGSVFTVVGRLDVHHPCEDHIKAHLHVVLPADYHEFERMKVLVDSVFEVLAIPPDETCEVEFISPESQVTSMDATDRDGMTDLL